MKLIYLFSKKGRLRFVSHLDLQRFLQRALNRTCLPIAFSKGFNPHPCLSIAGALAMGYESEYEAFEVKIEGSIDKETAIATMRSALPDELYIKDVYFTDDNHPSMMALVKMADYIIKPNSGYDELKKAVEVFNASESIKGIRKTKSGEREVDVRKLCISLSASEGKITARLMLTEQETLKPDLLMETLCSLAKIEVPDVRVTRTALLGLNSKGEAVPVALL